MMNPESLMMSLAFGSKSGGKTPTGTKQIAINANGVFTEDVADFASVEVSVDVPVDGAEMLNGIVDGSFVGDYVNNDVETIGSYKFYGMYGLKSLSCKNVTIVGSDAFESCSYITSVDLPKATTINYRAFYHDGKLSSVNIPLVETIGDGAFSGCILTGDILLERLKSIGYSSFSNGQFESFTAPVIKTLGGSCFDGCSKLKKVDMLGGDKSSIANYAFSSCPVLETLIIRGTDGVTSLGAASKIDQCTNITVYVPDALVDAYKAATNWSAIADRIVGLSTYTES